MNTRFCCVLAIVALAASPMGFAQSSPDAARSDSKVERNGEVFEADCGEMGDVTLVGSGNTVTAAGECRVLTLKGNGNIVNVAHVGSIVVEGTKNSVVWQHATGNNTKPLAKISGNDNTVRHYDDVPQTR